MMKLRRGSRPFVNGFALALALLLPVPILAAGLTIKPLEGQAVVIDAAALEAMPKVSVQARDDAGVAAEYTGVALSAVLAMAGVEFGKSVRGARLTEYVVVAAADGYKALFAIAELDPMFRDRPVILCYAKGGAPLPEKEGPLRLVVADEVRHARWVRQVNAIEVGRVP